MVEYVVGLVLGGLFCYLLLLKPRKFVERQTITTRQGDTVVIYSDDLQEYPNRAFLDSVRKELDVERVLILPSNANIQVIHKHEYAVAKIREGLDKLTVKDNECK